MTNLSVRGKERKEKSDDEAESLLCGQEETVKPCQVTPSLSPFTAKHTRLLEERAR